MAEQYAIAAWRLELEGDTDDAGYHFGISGETAVKYALRASGVEAAWVATAGGAPPHRACKHANAKALSFA
jgi:hypothetical protein